MLSDALLHLIRRQPNPRPSSHKDCGGEEMGYYATRMDFSQYITDKALLARAGGKIYAVYVWTPESGVYIASLTPSAEVWTVDFVPESWDYDDENSSEEWFDISMEFMRDTQIPDYTDHSYMKRKLDTPSTKFIGCFESAEDAVEHYNGNPTW